MISTSPAGFASSPLPHPAEINVRRRVNHPLFRGSIGGLLRYITIPIILVKYRNLRLPSPVENHEESTRTCLTDLGPATAFDWCRRCNTPFLRTLRYCSRLFPYRLTDS